MFFHNPAAPSNFVVDFLVSAIRDQKRVLVDYNGHRRLLEPHAVGRCKNGNVLLRAWQESGGSNSGRPSGWKLITVGRLQIAETDEGTFAAPRPQYKRGDRAMREIFQEL